MRRRKGPPVCRRLGCEARCETWQLVCAACWHQVPAALRNRYAEARRLSLGPIKRDLGNQILKLLGRKPAAPDASTQAYDRIATMTGDRDVTA